jgi:methylmalonyl-CoA mutase cobalamin-binding domain/chain
VEGLRAAGAPDVVVVAGGIIPEEDVAELTGKGVRKVFGPGTKLAEITAWVAAEVRPRTRAA